VKIIVQKFGGTSVASHENRLAAVKHIEGALAEGYGVVVVVSAMGRQGDPYATDTLLSTVGDGAVASKRDLDILMSCGEAISSVVFASLLRSRGHDAVVLNGGQAGIVTNHQYGNARILDVRPTLILELLQQGKIVVVMGFQGATEDGDITTLGRGGSDTTATALGVALCAEYVDIFTDVNGIMTADPRIVPDARILDRTTYTEICDLGYHGAKVIHPRAVELAMQKNIPVRVRGTLSSDAGTLIANPVVTMEHTLPDSNQQVTGITQMSNMAQIQLEDGCNGKFDVLAAMAENDIHVDLVFVNRDRMSYILPSRDAELAVRILQERGYSPKALPNCAKVSVVRPRFTEGSDIMARMIGVLSEKAIEIHSSGDSHSVIWCLVNGPDMEKAVQALHDEFQLGQDETISIQATPQLVG